MLVRIHRGGRAKVRMINNFLSISSDNLVSHSMANILGNANHMTKFLPRF